MRQQTTDNRPQTEYASRIPYPASRVPHPASRIPYPASRIPHPASRIPFVLLILLLLSFALRVYRIGELNMWGDEAFSVFSAHRSLEAITLEGAENDPHPPLYYYLLHYYLPLFGASEFALRFFSAFFGAATIALVYKIGSRLFDPRVGALGALIAALAPFHVFYSQEIRMYSLAMFLGAGVLYAFVRLWQSNVIALSLRNPRSEIRNSEIASQTALATPALACGASVTHGGQRSAVSGRYWLGYALFLFPALYSLYHAAFILLALGIFLLTQLGISPQKPALSEVKGRKDRKDFLHSFFALFESSRFNFLLRWLAVSLSVVLLFLPWLVLRFSATLGHLEDRAGGATPLNLPIFFARGFAALSVGATIQPAFAILVAAILLIAFFCAIKTAASDHRDALLIAIVCIPILAVYPLYLAIPIFSARVFALAFVPLALLLARALALIPARPRVLALVALVAVSAYSLNDYYFRFNRYNPAAEDYLPVIRAVAARAQAGDVVLFHAFWQEGYFYSHHRGAPLEYRDLNWQKDLDYAVARSRNVWALVQNIGDHPAEAFLARNAFPLAEQKFGTMRLLAYRAGSPGRAETFSPPFVFDNGIALLGYRVNDAPIEAGRGAVTLELNWLAAQKIADDFTISVRVVDARGEKVWAQVDSPPVSGFSPTSAWKAGEFILDRHGLEIPPAAPPGDYAIQIVLYQFDRNEVASVVAPESRRGVSLLLPGILIGAPNR